MPMKRLKIDRYGGSTSNRYTKTAIMLLMKIVPSRHIKN